VFPWYKHQHNIIPGLCFINAIRFTGEWGNFYLLSEERFLEGTWRQWAERTAGCGV
jgi:hypothetical protein